MRAAAHARVRLSDGDIRPLDKDMAEAVLRPIVMGTVLVSICLFPIASYQAVRNKDAGNRVLLQ